MSIEDIENKLNGLMKDLQEKIAQIDDKCRYRNLAVEYAIKCNLASDELHLIGLASKIEKYIVNGNCNGNRGN